MTDEAPAIKAPSTPNPPAATEAPPKPNPIAVPTPGSTAIKPNSTTTKSNSIKLPSISDIKSGKFELKKEEKSIEVDLPKNDFSYGDFKHYWDEAITKIAAKNQASTNAMIAQLNPDLQGVKIHLKFNNKVQQELFQTERPFISGYLREKLQNFDIDFELNIDTTTQDTTPYTNSEKFKAMAEKNPNLQVLRDVLGLDIG